MVQIDKFGNDDKVETSSTYSSDGKLSSVESPVGEVPPQTQESPVQNSNLFGSNQGRATKLYRKQIQKSRPGCIVEQTEYPPTSTTQEETKKTIDV